MCVFSTLQPDRKRRRAVPARSRETAKRVQVSGRIAAATTPDARLIVGNRCARGRHKGMYRRCGGKTARQLHHETRLMRVAGRMQRAAAAHLAQRTASVFAVAR